MNQLNKIIYRVNFQLYAVALLKCLLVAGSAFFVIMLFTNAWPWAILGSLLVLTGMVFWTKLFVSKRQQTLAILHHTLGDTEYSLELLQKNTPNLAEQLQLERLFTRVKSLKTPYIINSNTVFYGLLFSGSLLAYGYFPTLKKSTIIDFVQTAQTRKTAINATKIPTFIEAKLIIVPPAYTGLSTSQSSTLNASALNGSLLTWQIRFSNHEHLTVKLTNNRAEELAFSNKGNYFQYNDELVNSGLYAIKAYWKDSLVYQSDFYRLESIPDLAPQIEPSSKELYRLHFLKDAKNVQIAAKISDDFKVSQAFIVATLARGSGENVKFREVKIPITQHNFKQENIIKNIDLKAFNFAPGDELYYYWAAFDNKQPSPNFTKSDTYFIVYKDTVQAEEAELATMAMNIMPEYFRSQRQIIIDTEKLIAKRKKVDISTFNSISNEIGFDQKALRLRYGQYLGEESESSIGGSHAQSREAEGDLLKGFVHDHDGGEHEHEMPEHQHEHAENKAVEENKDPLASLLADYVHSHDDAETNTFYEQSTKALLKMALEQMWQSELHLRLYEPEKAIPFEHKALEYLKSAQQKARTFVKKTSFDPPPIKEKEKRMTGELMKFNQAFQYQKNYSQQQIETLVSEVMGIISTKEKIQKINSIQQQKVLALGTYLSTKIINSNVGHIGVLGLLQRIINDKKLSEQEFMTLKTGIYQLIGKTIVSKNNPTNPSYLSENKLQKAFWKNVQ